MPTTIPVSQPIADAVPVTVIFNAPGAVGLPFNQALIVGASGVIDSVNDRLLVFDNLDAVLTGGFSLTDPEYLAAQIYFGQSPPPLQLWIGAQDLTAIQSAVVATTPIAAITLGNSGGTGYAIGDVVHVSGVTNSAIIVSGETGGVVNALTIFYGGTGATVANNIATAAVTGVGTGLTIDVTAVGTGHGTGYIVGDVVAVAVGGTGAYLQVTTVGTAGSVTGLQTIIGQQGTGFAVAQGLATTSGHGSNLTVDITAIGETPTQAVAACRLATPLWYCCMFVGSHMDGTPVTNNDLESIAAFLEAATPASQFFYTDSSTATLMGLPSSLPGVLQALAYRRTHGVYSTVGGPTTTASITAMSATITVSVTAGITVGQSVVGYGIPVGTTVLSITGTTVVLSAKATLTNATAVLSFGPYPNNIYACAGPMGRAMGLNTQTPGSYFAMAYKRLTGVVAEALSQTQSQAIAGTNDRTTKGLNCNVAVDYGYGAYVSVYQFGTQASGNFFDEILQLDMLANNIQTTVFNTFTTALSVPITDSGVNQIKNLVLQCLQTSQQIGFIAGQGTWQGVSIGTGNTAILPGENLSSGYAIYAPAVSTLSPQQRANRQLPPISVALIEASSGLYQQVVVYVQP